MIEGPKTQVSGMGLCSPYGVGVERALSGLMAGQVCIGMHQLFGLNVMGAQVPKLDPESESLRQEGRPAEAFLRLAVTEAVQQSGIDPTGVPLFIGTCSGEMQRFERGLLPPTWYEQPGQGVARALGLGQVMTFTSACTSALAALAAAHTAIICGRIERAIVAGTDAMCAFTASGFLALKAVAHSTPMPFSRLRSGLGFGEGAAAIVLEKKALREKQMQESTALVDIGGVALSCDAKHMTAPRQDALGLERCVRAALLKAGLHTVDVYVSHGTATVANDAMELTLGRRLQLLDLPWLAHKGFIGHAMGVSGLMSFILSSEQIRRQLTPPLTYGDLEPGVRLDASLVGCQDALLVAAAFGGSNAAVVFSVRR